MSETDSNYLKTLTLNQRIAHIRKINGHSQEKAAKAFGIKTSTYSQKERRGFITCEFLIEFCRYFDVDSRLILYGEVPEETAPSPPLPPIENPTTKGTTIIPPGIILGARQKCLLTILQNFHKCEREATYKFVDVLRKSKPKEFIAKYPEFFE